jgi:hypothetical protein
MAMSSSERNVLFRERNPEYAKEYRAKRKEHYKQLAKDWYAKNKEVSIERAIQWIKENKQRASELNLASYHRNKEIRKVQYKAWTQANKGKVLARVRKYELAKINRTPQWLDKDDGWVIQEIYELSYKRTKMTGIKWHVDHIIPLQGKLVSGLHVPANLQVIPAIINMGKGNKFNG